VGDSLSFLKGFGSANMLVVDKPDKEYIKEEEYFIPNSVPNVYKILTNKT
jgi:hypothetical protein